MKIEIYMYGNGYDAYGYYEEGTITVLKGSKIRDCEPQNFKKNQSVFDLRENPDIVNKDFIVLKSCTFTTPSAAAQFVMGGSRDGYNSWKTDKNEKSKTLGLYLENAGIRERKTRKK